MPTMRGLGRTKMRPGCIMTPMRVAAWILMLSTAMAVGAVSVGQDAKEKEGERRWEEPTFEVRPLPEEGRLAIFRPALSKFVEVFGVNVIASAGVDDEKVQHAAIVLAEWLDSEIGRAHV